MWHFLVWILLPWVWATGLQIEIGSALAHSSSSTTPSVGDFTSLPSSYLTCSLVFRYGEADHPGPDDPVPVQVETELQQPPPSTLRIGCSNPCGLRGKEALARQLGCGIWCYAETHLTMASQKMMAAALAHGGWQQNRQVRSHFGAPVQYRSNSVEAGTWSGVGILSDYPSREIHLALENGERSSGRLLVTRHLVHYMPILVAACYGFPAGPTWPNSKQLTGNCFQR